jgi:hypothetical protein
MFRSLAFLLIFSPALAQEPLRAISGLETMRRDATRIEVYRGTATDNTGNGKISLPRGAQLDVAKIGFLGRDDVATKEDVEKFREQLMPDSAMPNGYRASMPNGKPLQGWYHVLYLANEKGQGGAMLTRQLSSQRLDRAGDARPPSDFILRRHSPAVHYYDGQKGFRPMVCMAWPNPVCDWTRLEKQEKFLIHAGESTRVQVIDVSDWVPPTGRILKMQVVVKSEGGVGGAYIKSLARSQGEVLVGHVNKAGDKSVNFVELATTSKRQIAFRTDKGVTLEIYAVGFSMLQPL